ncbi:N-acetylglucosamine-6-phosphate deacetylase [Pseudobutyrivibrio sp.]|uniref:N-acetylglucosamine-6-phosphate deacetylase n=1 Tax=Pseudobutyrivibrio sp. TaxID=2014367 RepID=UPI001DECB1C6|nr:N-acetylglucosamine-6-phosphate deacetylase [Pseudobutyrivibrio sp.]MBE5909926.1 N-acetylglucosamine-6-phosphate deacetylase [Pseudobutyrivibrio sp.]
MIIKNGNVYCSDGGFKIKDLYVADGFIVDDRNLAAADGKVIDATGKYVIPSLVDVHSHGAFGHDFCDADVEGLKAILKYEKSCGITSYCPTSMTFPEDRLEKIFNTVNEVGAEGNLANIVGINMEGPFISYQKRGAQNPDYILAPDVEMFRRLNRICDNKIRLITMAPEVEGATDFIKELCSEVNISVGHTMANYDEATAAFKAGANHVTHLFNAMPPLNHREPGVIGAAADSENVFVELICDGIHIHPSAIRLAFKVFGSDRVVLISDSMEATGMVDGEYELGGQKVFKKGNHATLADGTLAGSATNLFDCMKKAVEFGLPLYDAVKSATTTPAKSIGMYPKIGALEVGSKADILIVSKDLELDELISM